MTSGAQGQYRWLSLAEYDISALLRLCPQLVTGKYLAVTSTDSDTLNPTQEQKAVGWRISEVDRVFSGTSWNPPDYRGHVTYSPA
jgi:hypothetical protein